MITIGGKNIGAEDFHKILFQNEKIQLDKNALKSIENNFHFLKDFSKDKILYGINTGLGPMSQYIIADEELDQLQYNLIRSHCTGMGNPMDQINIKSIMIARLNTLMQGYSGVHPELLILLSQMINNNILPVIFEHGSVGASGDLVQLAHLALALIGEGEVFFNNERIKTIDALKKCGLNPMQIYLREGLAIMNGTSGMTGIGMINLLNAKNLLNWSIIASSMINEIVQSYDDHFSKELNNKKLHPGQQKIAKAMRAILSGSKMIKKRDDDLYNNNLKLNVLGHKVQEYYSLRCVPQITGPILETIEQLEIVLSREVNSINDNPVIDHETNNVYHGGNFHGDYIAFEMDKAKIAITKLSMLAERQINYLMNSKLNDILPPFVNLGILGKNLGLQGTQFTATSTTAENQTISYPMYLHSIPNNNDNQDIVSMGTNAALLAQKVIENTSQVLAIEMLAIIQAVDYLNCGNQLSPVSQEIYNQLREIIPVFKDDKILYNDLNTIKEHISKIKSYNYQITNI